jgi:hypothetical protein
MHVIVMPPRSVGGGETEYAARIGGLARQTMLGKGIEDAVERDAVDLAQ